MKRSFQNGHKCPLGCAGTGNGYVAATAMAAGQSQRFYPGMGILNWYYLNLQFASLDLTSPRARTRMRAAGITVYRMVFDAPTCLYVPWDIYHYFININMY
jgi:hypothetical protein